MHKPNVIFCMAAFVASVAGPAVAQDLRISGEVGYDSFPDERGTAPDDGSFATVEIEGELPISNRVSLAFDTQLYSASYFDEAEIDPGVALVFANGPVEARLGYVASQWGRTDESTLSFLTAPNSVFGYPSDLDDLSQPGLSVRYTFGPSLAVEFTALTELQSSEPLQFDERLGYGLPTSEVVDDDESAFGLRLTGNANGIDWRVFAFSGLDRRPSFVAGLGAGGPEVTAFYDRVEAVGFEAETTVGLARVWAEGARIFDGRDSTGARTDYTVVAAGTELQWFALAGRELDLIVDVRGQYDSREDLATAPFQSSIATGVTLLQSSRLPLTFEATYGVDLESEADFWSVTGTKQISEDPFLDLKLSYAEFRDGDVTDVTSVWENDRRLRMSLDWSF